VTSTRPAHVDLTYLTQLLVTSLHVMKQMFELQSMSNQRISFATEQFLWNVRLQ
jgi:hypothetical protein